MSNQRSLHQIILDKKEVLKVDNSNLFEIPNYIRNNLKYPFYDWQKEAFEHFLFCENLLYQKQLDVDNQHKMFHMATGTGKTLLMAGLILYYYKKGYRHFIFFVNRNNIVDKTENNFINKIHNKYLYKDKIIIDDKTILINKVETFTDYPQGIEIKFTSIQQLYTDIHNQKENQTTLDDLHRRDVIMLADEAHHLNADTKRKKKEGAELSPTELTNKSSIEDIERKGWEHTVIELILNKNQLQPKNNKNVLLEFTATIPENGQVAKKYENKIIYEFSLKRFLKAGYTKQINLISSTLDKKDRIFQALLFQWYRHKIALKNEIVNFKPVILFRSKTTKESRSDYEDFLNLTENSTGKDFHFLQNIWNKIYESEGASLFEMGKSRTKQVFQFIKDKNIQYEEIANWIKRNFSEKNIIITNFKGK